MLVSALKNNLNTNLLRMEEIQRQLTTGKIINKPSDDPAGLVKSLRLRTNLNEGEQYNRNIGDGLGYMETSDGALLSINELMQKIRELTVKAATGTNAEDDFKAIAKEVREMNEQLKLLANTTYGSKYIFGGTNVTEPPFTEKAWMGNDEELVMEIGIGVTVPVNIKMKDFFTGRLNDLYIDPNSGINSIETEDIQEGDYELHTSSVTAAADSSAHEAQSYLSAVPDSGSFFFESQGVAATLGVGQNVETSDTSYSGSLLIEAKRIDPATEKLGPRASLDAGSDADGGTLTLTRPLYTKDNNGNLIAIADGADISNYFTYTGEGTLSSATYHYNAATDEVSIDFDTSGGSIPELGDTIVWNNDWDPVAGQTVAESGKGTAYDRYGNEYLPRELTFDDNGGEWVEGTYDAENGWEYHEPYEASQVMVDIKGHIYTADGDYKYVELENVFVDMETGVGGEMIRISAADIDDPNFTEDLVIWNNGTEDLGGINYIDPEDPENPNTPQLQVGDKTVISFSAQETAGRQKVNMHYEYTDIQGNLVNEAEHNLSFDAGILDDNETEINFFSINELTGLVYDGSIKMDIGSFGDSTDGSVFSNQMGIFAYVDDLARKIEVGKLPEVGNELAGNDIRMQELLLHRATIGARVNRLELQMNRIEYNKESLTSLLAKTEDADIAEVIMNLQLQENVYRASLAAGARIIQPSLVDFLR